MHVRLDASLIVQDPEWLPHTFDPSGSQLMFVRVTREQHRSLPFLDDHRLDDRFSRTIVPTDAVADALSATDSGQVRFVFHTAFCCSTLLANALDASGMAVGLKEPAIFMNLLHRLQQGHDDSGNGRLDLVLRLLGRRFAGAEVTVAKPACFATPLLPKIMKAVPDARAILLHSDLRTFLLAIAKRGIRGRSWGRRVYCNCLRHIPMKLGIEGAAALELTDLQVAGLGWLMRRHFIHRMAAQFGAGRMLELDAESFLHDPRSVLREASSFFGLFVDDHEITRIASGPVFGRHSKEGKPFGALQRESGLQELRGAHGEEVEIVADWVERIDTDAGHRGAIGLRLAS